MVWSRKRVHKSVNKCVSNFVAMVDTSSSSDGLYENASITDGLDKTPWYSDDVDVTLKSLRYG